jgi:hypothetical protein
MFTFVLKENKTDIEIIVTRVILAVAGVLSLLYGDYMISLFAAISLFTASYFVKAITNKLNIGRPFLLVLAAIVLFVGMHSYLFSAILLCYALLLKYLQKRPEVFVTTTEIKLSKVFSNKVFTWTEFNNIILKDGILTLDFIDNTLLQLSIDDHETTVHESLFNSFCKDRLLSNSI